MNQTLLVAAQAAARFAAVHISEGCDRCRPGARLAEMCQDGQRMAQDAATLLIEADPAGESDPEDAPVLGHPHFTPALPWAVGMHDEDLRCFLADVREATWYAEDPQTALEAVERACRTWRAIGRRKPATTPAPAAADTAEGHA